MTGGLYCHPEERSDEGSPSPSLRGPLDVRKNGQKRVCRAALVTRRRISFTLPPGDARRTQKRAETCLSRSRRNGENNPPRGGGGLFSLGPMDRGPAGKVLLEDADYGIGFISTCLFIPTSTHRANSSNLSSIQSTIKPLSFCLS